MTWHHVLQDDSVTQENAPPWIEYLYTSSNRNQPVECFMASAPYLNIPFDEAVRAAGPKTFQYAPGEREAVIRMGEIPVEPLIWQAGQLYETQDRIAPRRATIVLANFVKREDITVSEALLWAQARELSAAHPLDIFSVCTALPELYKELRCGLACIASTDERSLDGVWRTPCVRLGGVEREVAFVPARYPLHDQYWFAFRTRETGREVAMRRYEEFFRA